MDRILLVEDNGSIVLGLKYLLEQEGFDLSVASSVKAGKEAFERERFDLVLMDGMLPDGDGFSLCKWMLGLSPCPVIFLTARDEEGDVVKGFELGAVDYIMKPFRNRELISRIRNGLRRNRSNEGNAEERLLRCGDLSLHPDSGRVFLGENEIFLTKLELRILSSMMAHPGKIFTREEILAGVWDLYGNYVNDNTLSVTMKRIREKLGDPGGERIKTIRGVGYRLEK